MGSTEHEECYMYPGNKRLPSNQPQGAHSSSGQIHITRTILDYQGTSRNESLPIMPCYCQSYLLNNNMKGSSRSVSITSSQENAIVGKDNADNPADVNKTRSNIGDRKDVTLIQPMTANHN